MKDDHRSQIVGFGASFALHIAVGLVLLFAWPARTKSPPNARSETIVVTLLSLDSVKPSHGAAPKSDASDRQSETSVAEPLASPSPSPSGASAPHLTERPAAAQSQEAQPASEASLQYASGADTEIYQRALLRHIERYRHYPDLARQDNIEGVVILRFRMDRDGRVLEAWVDRSSGFTILDSEAVAAVYRAQPLPPIPARLPDRLGVALPISFALQ